MSEHAIDWTKTSELMEEKNLNGKELSKMNEIMFPVRSVAIFIPFLFGKIEHDHNHSSLESSKRTLSVI